MMNRVRYLLKESIKTIKKGGPRLFFHRFNEYLSNLLNKKALFSPLVPPVGFSYKMVFYSLGYREVYLYNYEVYGVPKVVPEPSDTVVEAGVYEGKDTAMYAKLADQVVGFEPSPRNHRRSKDNLQKFDNVQIYNKGLWNEKDELQIQYGETGGDDGFLEPDSGNEGGVHNAPVNTLEAYVEQLDINDVDFLKIEAEGAEPEVIEGLGDLRPDKIVVNADEERGANPTGREVMEALQPIGYNLVGVKMGCILFFSREKSQHQAFRSEFC